MPAVRRTPGRVGPASVLVTSGHRTDPRGACRDPALDPRQYVQDVRTGNAPVRQVVRGIAVGDVQPHAGSDASHAARETLDPGWSALPLYSGHGGQESHRDARPAARAMQVKSIEEISATLNAENSNRGLSFDREMLKYCGRTAQVLRRVDHIIDESSGQMLTMKTPCIVLADVTCTADYHRAARAASTCTGGGLAGTSAGTPRTSQAAGDRS